uniref:peptidylprolyl isomerase n=1 Tax=Oncorhynchus kisutch TaxID=8019 RepID=A0A8C7HFW9_ONCKI
MHGMIYLAVLVAFAACDAPPVPLDDIVIEKTFVPEQCGRAVKVGDYVRYHYNGMFPDGKKFDSSYDRGSTYNVYVGKKQLIEGMDRALVGMCVNERRLVTIPPQLAYGKEGYGDVIPSDAILNFDVLLLDVWNADDGVQSETYYTPENCSRKVEVSDYVRYHYNGTCTKIPDTVVITTNYKPEVCETLAKKGDFVKYHYNASLMDGSFIDSTYNYGKTYNIVLGANQVVPGMEEGLKEMCVGERRHLVIPPHLGYGERGVDGEVPASAVLVFDIEMIEMEAGLPDGYMFIWNEEVSADLFTEMDADKDLQVLASEVLITAKSRPQLHTYNIVLGANQVVPGMEEGLKEMCVGERRHLVIPPHLGYGERGVPASAVLVFDIEMIEMEAGLPDGYMFIWNEEVSADLFTEMDADKDLQVLASEFSDYILRQVNEGKGRLAPGFNANLIIENMFSNQDRNGDGKITEEEFKLKADETPHDEL